MDSAQDPAYHIPSGSQDAETHSSEPNEASSGAEQNVPSIEEEVKQLAGNISSWWSGFSQRVRVFLC